MEDSMGGDSGKVVSESSLAHPTKMAVEDVWMKYIFVSDIGGQLVTLCGFCSNTGLIKNPDLKYPKPCLCANGRSLTNNN